MLFQGFRNMHPELAVLSFAAQVHKFRISIEIQLFILFFGMFYTNLPANTFAPTQLFEMRKTLFTLLGCACLFLMGCPLMTNTPIKGAPANAPWITGSWAGLDSNGKANSGWYKVEADPSTSGGLTITPMDEDGSRDHSQPVRKAEYCRINESIFLSVYDNGGDISESGYYHYAVERTASGDLSLIPLKEKLVALETSGKDLAAFISGHPKSGYLDLANTELYRRRK